jgi:LuxR family transcriptional regulator, quorum-sensing system regulator BjaR1
VTAPLLRLEKIAPIAGCNVSGHATLWRYCSGEIRGKRVLAEETCSFLERVSASDTATEVATLLHREAEKLGFNGLAMVWLPEPGSRQPLSFETVKLPRQYFERYAAGRYQRFSPLVRKAAVTIHPFRWEEATYDPVRSPMAHKVMTEARDFGLKTGWCLPVHQCDRLLGWVSASSDGYIDPKLEASQLHVMALWAHSRVRQLDAARVEKCRRLSPREREVVLWLSSGHTTDEIADILKLSARTVDFHIANAGLKLGTANRTHTVVEAIRTRQISV